MAAPYPRGGVHDTPAEACDTPRMLSVALVWFCLGAAAPLDPSSAEELRVWLDGHKGALDVSGDAPVLRFRALAHSRLPVKVEAIEVGVLFAKEGDDLAAVEPGPLYDNPADGQRTASQMGNGDSFSTSPLHMPPVQPPAP